MITGDFINIMEKIRTHLYEKSSKPIYDKDIASSLNILFIKNQETCLLKMLFFSIYILEQLSS